MWYLAVLFKPNVILWWFNFLLLVVVVVLVFVQCGFLSPWWSWAAITAHVFLVWRLIDWLGFLDGDLPFFIFVFGTKTHICLFLNYQDVLFLPFFKDHKRSGENIHIIYSRRFVSTPYPMLLVFCLDQQKGTFLGSYTDVSVWMMHFGVFCSHFFLFFFFLMKSTHLCHQT